MKIISHCNNRSINYRSIVNLTVLNSRDGGGGGGGGDGGGNGAYDGAILAVSFILF